MIGSMAVVNEVARNLDNPDNMYKVGGSVEVTNGVRVVVLIHNIKNDKPNKGGYIEITVFTDMPLKDQVQAALQEADLPIKEEPVEEEKEPQAGGQAAPAPEENDKKKEGA